MAEVRDAMLDTQQKLIATNALIAKYDRAIFEHPEDAGVIAIAVWSLRKIKRQLEETIGQ